MGVDFADWVPQRLTGDPKVSDQAGEMVLAALDGDEALGEYLETGGTAVADRLTGDPVVADPEPAAAGAFLDSEVLPMPREPTKRVFGSHPATGRCVVEPELPVARQSVTTCEHGWGVASPRAIDTVEHKASSIYTHRHFGGRVGHLRSTIASMNPASAWCATRFGQPWQRELIRYGDSRNHPGRMLMGLWARR